MPGHNDDDRGNPHGGAAGTATLAGSTTDQLVAASRSITTLALQIDSILATYVDPPEPDKPTAISATSTIQTKSAHITATANAIMLKLRGTA